MENDKFQELVLEHLATLTQEITEIKTDISGKFKNVDEKFAAIDEKFNRIEKKLDTTITQTAELTEFRIENTQMMEKIIDSFDFLKSHQFSMEEELFRLKKKIS